jgi:hypothetical protein
MPKAWASDREMVDAALDYAARFEELQEAPEEERPRLRLRMLAARGDLYQMLRRYYFEAPPTAETPAEMPAETHLIRPGEPVWV